ncbi:MAG: amino acid racemase [bacterium]|nr:MAG: amino acid racemase [bacterium]
MHSYQKIGILGGMGPDSTGDFFLKIISLFQNGMGANFTSDFPAITVESITFPHKNEAKSKYEETKMRAICRGCQTLEMAGVDFIVVPCNSAHHYINQMRDSVKIDVLSIIEETAKNILSKGLSKVLLLATEYTIKNNLYSPLKNMGVEAVIPNQGQQNLVMEAIKNVFAGKRLPEDRENLAKIIFTHKCEDGIEGAILGCTELPLALEDETVDEVLLFDTLKILASSTFKRSVGLA